MGFSNFPAAGAGLQPYQKTFYSSEVWAIPSGVKTVEVTCAAGGGGGGSYNLGGSGGVTKAIIDISAASTVAITVGAGGAVNSSNGGDTSFGSYLTTEGGFYSAGTSTYAIAAGSGGIVQPGFGFSRELWSINYTKPTVANSHIFYLNNILFALGGTGTLTANYYSTNNGSTWTPFTLATALGSQDIEMGWTGTMYYAYNRNYDIMGQLQTSTDGITWVNRTLPAGNQKAMTYAFGKFYVVPYSGSTSTYYTSTDAITWTTQAFPSAYSWGGIHGDGNTRIFAMSPDGYTLTSTNGTTWTTQVTSANFSISGYTNCVIKVNKKGPDSYYIAISGPLNASTARNAGVYTFSGSSLVSALGYTMTVPSSQQSAYIVNNWVVCMNTRMNMDTGVTSATQTTPVSYIIYAQPAYVPAINSVFTCTNGYTSGSGDKIFKILAQFITGRWSTRGYSYNGGLGGTGAGGYGSLAVYANTYLYSVTTPGPGIDGFGIGAGSGALSYGEGGDYNKNGNSGAVVVRWWA
jgi:hypothetical protein